MARAEWAGRPAGTAGRAAAAAAQGRWKRSALPAPHLFGVVQLQLQQDLRRLQPDAGAVLHERHLVGGGQNETYNSGANGTVAGQYNSNNGGLWEVRNGQLWGSYGNAPLQLVQPFSVTRNSNGSPIINSLGKEYSSCR